MTSSCFKKNRANAKGFTLIELLIVIAIIGILASVVLVRLTGAREKAKWNNYIAYVSQVTKMTKAAAVMGYFESIPSGRNGCLGIYNYNVNQCWSGSYFNDSNLHDNIINNALANVGTVPNGVSYPDNNTGFGTIIATAGTTIRIYASMGVSTNVAEGIANMDKYCSQFGWNDWDNTKRSNVWIYCWTDIPKS